MVLEKLLVPELFALIGHTEQAILPRRRSDQQNAEKAEKNQPHVQLYTICSVCGCDYHSARPRLNSSLSCKKLDLPKPSIPSL